MKAHDRSIRSTFGSWNDHSTGLNPCGEIYGFCVDNVWEDIFKIREGVYRTAEAEDSRANRTNPNSKIFARPDKTLEVNESALFNPKSSI